MDVFLDQLLLPYEFYGRDMWRILFFISASCEPLSAFPFEVQYNVTKVISLILRLVCSLSVSAHLILMLCGYFQQWHSKLNQLTYRWLHTTFINHLLLIENFFVSFLLLIAHFFVSYLLMIANLSVISCLLLIAHFFTGYLLLIAHFFISYLLLITLDNTLFYISYLYANW